MPKPPPRPPSPSRSTALVTTSLAATPLAPLAVAQAASLSAAAEAATLTAALAAPALAAASDPRRQGRVRRHSMSTAIPPSARLIAATAASAATAAAALATSLGTTLAATRAAPDLAGALFATAGLNCVVVPSRRCRMWLLANVCPQAKRGRCGQKRGHAGRSVIPGCPKE